MTRPIRIDYPGAIHHVTCRANRREPRFRCRTCRGQVFKTLEETATRFQTRFLAYAVMNNHIHLVLESPDGRLPRTMQLFVASLTRRINHHHGDDGHVFRGRYFNRVVENPEYLAYLLAYVHLNPSSAGHPRHLSNPEWTSHAHYLAGTGPSWLNPERLLTEVGGQQSYVRLIESVRAGKRAKPHGFAERVLLQPRSSDLLAVPEPDQDPTPAAHELLRQAEGVVGPIPRGSLQGTGSARRDLAIWWALRQGTTQAALARSLGLSPSSVCRSAMRTVDRLARDPEAQALASKLDCTS